MSEITIRPATADDHPALVRIWRSAVDATHDFLAEADRDAIESHLASDYFPAVTLVLAEIEDSPVGFAGALNGNLEMLFVDAARRGAGIGTLLLQHAIAQLAVTRVDVNEQNPTATAFYARRGFEVIGRSELDDAGRPYPLLHLRLRG
ncbi:acetyltransferase [Microbacterium arabinogalactanolyticum]|uniref:acetyltransferase n=1 Tax=Microbacterium arabinogalactanolyticum TaxID=69365 RepID=UPI0040449B89